MAKVSRRIATGNGRVRLRRKVARHTLRRGSYRVRITAVDAAGNRSAPKTRRFTVIR